MLKLTLSILLSCIYSSCVSSYAALPVQKLRAADSIPHSETRFTQGLFFDGDELWESTGIEGKSKIYRMTKKGEAFDSVAMPERHFGEGIAKIGNRIIWLTWQSRQGFILSAQPLQFLGTFRVSGEGWGAAVWRGNWLISDGSATLYELSSKDMSVVSSIKIQAEGIPVRNLNELEITGDTLYANVWGSDSIAVISLPGGSVVKWLDFSEHAKSVRKMHPRAEVLNGIAFDGKDMWITGKNWPWYFKVF